MEMARIVQAADFKDQLDDHPGARGLQLISHGFPMVTNDDQETVARAAFVYDSLYASIESNPTPVTHGWILCKIEIIVIASIKNESTRIPA